MAKGKFASKLSKFQVKALVQVDQVRRASILEMFSIVVTATPVDEGFLRGAWQITLNSPAAGEFDTAPDKTGDTVIAEVLKGMGKLVDVVYFSNLMPYAHRIEYEGWSAQAKDGMVRANVKLWPRIVKNKAKEFMK